MSKSRVGTEADGPHEKSDVDFVAAGERTGHGMVWLWAPPFVMPPAPGWKDVADPPVIALLDTRVQPHSWLDEFTQGISWRISDLENATPDPAPAPGKMPAGPFYGHGTFIAGLIRRLAPGTQLLSLPVMDEDGEVEDEDLAAALRQLAAYQDQHRRRLVVLMAFGREAAGDDLDDDTDLQRVKQALLELARPGVLIVASAGNQRTDRRTYPAAFADDPELSASVVSVGAGKGTGASEEDRDRFSNFGDWVEEWRRGTNLPSLMPAAPRFLRRVDGEVFEVDSPDTNNYAWWSGTSFAAAIYACERAAELVDGGGPLATSVTES